MSAIASFRTALERQKGIRDNYIKQLAIIKDEQSQIAKSLKIAEKARVIIQIVAKETQQELEFQISDIVSYALAAVFNDPYSFNVQFVLRRDKTEADLIWKNENEEYPPNGGGVRDISAFALREAMRCLQPHQEAPFLLLDEPIKHLKPFAAQQRALLMMKAISKKLGLQIIMVTSAETDKDKELMKSANTAYKVVKQSKVSQVERI